MDYKFVLSIKSKTICLIASQITSVEQTYILI